MYNDIRPDVMQSQPFLCILQIALLLLVAISNYN